jgi:ATP-dependent Zn protease
MGIVKITIVPETIGEGLTAAGYVQYKSVPHQGKRDRNYLIHMLAGLMAGSEGESLFMERSGKGKGQFNIGRSNDIERVGKMAHKMILDLHLIPELDAAHAYIDSKGDIVGNLPPELRAKYDTFVQELLAESRKLALATVERDWDIIQAGSHFLMKYGGALNGDQYEKLVELVVQAREGGKDAKKIDFEAVRKFKKPNCEKLLAG